MYQPGCTSRPETDHSRWSSRFTGARGAGAPDLQLQRPLPISPQSGHRYSGAKRSRLVGIWHHLPEADSSRLGRRRAYGFRTRSRLSHDASVGAARSHRRLRWIVWGFRNAFMREPATANCGRLRSIWSGRQISSRSPRQFLRPGESSCLAGWAIRTLKSTS